MVQVLLEAARSPGLQHEEDPSRTERGPDALQDPGRRGKIVDRIERRDHVPGLLLDGLGRVRRPEAGVAEPPPLGFLPGRRDRLFRDVHAGEAAPGEGLGHEGHGPAPAAADVEDTRARLHLLHEPGDEGEVELQEVRLHLGHRALVLDLVEAGVRLVVDPAPGPEALHDPILHGAEDRDVLHPDRAVLVPGGPSEACGVRRGQDEAAGVGIVLHDPPRGHGAEPLPNVAGHEPGGLGDLSGGAGRELRQDVEEARPVAHADHEGQGGVVEDPVETVLEGCHASPPLTGGARAPPDPCAGPRPGEALR